MVKGIKKKIITVVTANYVDQLVPDLLKKSFDAYIVKDFSQKHFQTSVTENSNATAGLVLTILALESYRNRIYYLEKKKINRSALGKDLSKMFEEKDRSFPSMIFTNLIEEMVIVRDAVVHNHLYEVEITSDKNWDMIGHTQKLLKDYGDPKRRKSGLVIEHTRRTKMLSLNVQPGKIGFEDLFSILVVFDLFVGISEKLFVNSYVPFRFSHKFNGEWISDLSHLLSYYYVNNPNKQCIKSMRSVFNNLRSSFEIFIPDHSDFFIDDVCPRCQEFGFHQPLRKYECLSCGFKIDLVK